MIRTRCRPRNISAKSSGARASICPKRISTIGRREVHARCRSSCRAGEKAHPVAAAPGRVPHRVRAGDARRAVHRRQGRADARAAEPYRSSIDKVARAHRHHGDSARARCASRWRTGPIARILPGVWIANDAMHDFLGKRRPFLTAKRLLVQPDLPRHLSHRHARRRSAPQDHQPHLPVHRSQGLDRTLRAGWRPGRLRYSARAFPRAARDRGRRRRAPWSRPSATLLWRPSPRPTALLRRRCACARRCASLNAAHGREDLLLKIGIHEGPCLAVMSERPAGLLRPDGQYCLPSTGARYIAIDPGHGAGHRQSTEHQSAGRQREADRAAPHAARRRLRSRGLRIP